MKNKNLILETNHCIGYGYMSYIEDGSDRKVIDFLINFCMWGGSTKTYDNYQMYELSEETMNFMQTNVFKSFLIRNNINLITDNDPEYNDILEKVFDKQ